MFLEDAQSLQQPDEVEKWILEMRTIFDAQVASEMSPSLALANINLQLDSLNSRLQSLHTEVGNLLSQLSTLLET